MAEEEQKSVAMWAEATRRLTAPTDDQDNNMSFLLQVLEMNTDIPIILTDSSLNISYNFV